MVRQNGGTVAEATMRPCKHNDWDDVRTRHGFKVLRCRECQGRWRLLNRNVNRCMSFLHDKCEDSAACGMLHVRRKKTNIEERYERFGDSVFAGVAPGIQRRAKHVFAEAGHSVGSPHMESAGSERSTPSPVPSCSSSGDTFQYTHSPYSWGNVPPPSFL